MQWLVGWLFGVSGGVDAAGLGQSVGPFVHAKESTTYNERRRVNTHSKTNALSLSLRCIQTHRKPTHTTHPRECSWPTLQDGEVKGEATRRLIGVRGPLLAPATGGTPGAAGAGAAEAALLAMGVGG